MPKVPLLAGRRYRKNCVSVCPSVRPYVRLLNKKVQHKKHEGTLLKHESLLIELNHWLLEGHWLFTIICKWRSEQLRSALFYHRGENVFSVFSIWSRLHVLLWFHYICLLFAFYFPICSVCCPSIYLTEELPAAQQWEPLLPSASLPFHTLSHIFFL